MSTVEFLKHKWHSRNFGRMIQWAAFSFVLYGIALSAPWPLVVQAALTKGANVNAGAFLGYWIDRNLFSAYDAAFRQNPEDFDHAVKAARLIARGLIVGACILGLAAGVGA